MAFAQEGGIVSGVVVNTWDGSPLAGVAVTVRGTTLATQTGNDGRFELKDVPAGDQVLRFSRAGFASATVTDVRVLPGQSTTVNGNIRPEFYDMEEYEVTAEEFAEQTEKILFERQQASSLMDAIGSEQFTKYGAGDAAQIVSRVTGVSLVGGKYAVVRGLSDRYTRTLLNGVEVPSADPYRMSPQLDLFPSAMIDRISVSKTFTPDQPGGTGGGTINIVTKPFPEQPFVKGSAALSYNPESNLRKFLAAPESSIAGIALPQGPSPLSPELFKLEAAPPIPGPASVRETPARAQLRADQANAAQSLLQKLGTTDFSAVEKSSPLNTALTASGGRTVPLFEKPLGIFAGLNYARVFSQLNDVELNRYSGNGALQKHGQETYSDIKTAYSANVNLGYRLSDCAEFGFNFMLAHTTDEEAQHASWDQLESREGDTLEQWQLHFTEREIQNYQLHGKHDLPFLADSTLNWMVSLAHTTQNEPNQRFFNYFLDPTGRATLGDAALPVPFYPSRYFREINEQSLNTKADWLWPLGFMPQESNIKIGFFNSNTDRQFKEEYFSYFGGENFDPTNPNSYLNNLAYLSYTAVYLGGIRTNYNFQRTINLAVGRPYDATQDILAGYAMTDLGVWSWLRVIGGARVEKTRMNIDAGLAGSSKIDQVDVLPAAAVVITFITNVNLRLSYAQTVARPSFREKAPIANYLPDYKVWADGNPELEMSAITSYDARLEWYPGPGDLLSFGVFYKKLERPIELYMTDLSSASVTWINRDQATVMGLEFEARKSFEFIAPQFRGLTLGVNAALIESETRLTDIEFHNKTDPDGDGVIDFPTSQTRPLYDQSPYIVNLDLTYDHVSSGTTFTIAANLTGPRIVLSTAQGPDIYEHPPISLDALISQRVGRYWTLRFGVRNILDPEYSQTYGDSPDDPIYQSYKRGRTFAIQATAEF
jgi:TonB-dependent receptor-like protein/carboxypeptidase family protein